MANDSDADDRDGLDVLGVLAEPTRRRVYDHVVANGDWVSRESVAAALGLERPTVAHHLDRLAGDGLLEVEFRRLTGRQGPGAGRPAKLYRRSAKELSVSIPPRDYHLAGRLLAEAADRSRLGGVPNGDGGSRRPDAAGRGRYRPAVAPHPDLWAGGGLLEVEFGRLTGRDGPGAGRPAKLYRGSAKELSVSIPPRDYHLAGRLLAEAADRARLDGVPIGDALDEAAAAAGRRLGGGIRQRIETATAAEAVARREITLAGLRSEEHTSELQSLMRNSYT